MVSKHCSKQGQSVPFCWKGGLFLRAGQHMDEVIFQTNVTFICMGFFSFWIKKKQIIQMSFVTGYIIKITFSVFNK